MKMQPGKLLTPTEKELDLIKKVDDIYSSGMGREFEDLVRAAINSEKERGQISKFDPAGTFYVIHPSNLPDGEHQDIFRRLCRVSPSDPVDFEAPDGKQMHAQLVEKYDFQRLIRALMRIVAKLLGLDREKTKNPDSLESNELTLG
ncbi:hypothetical protein D3C85_1008280 [compost metagenome]